MRFDKTVSFRFDCWHLIDTTLSKKQNPLPTTADDPLQHDDYFNVRSMVTLDDLFK